MSQDPSVYEDQVNDLFIYVVRNNLEAVSAILKKHPYCANQLYSKETLLDYPCRHGKLKMAELLIECGVQVNNCNQIGSPPLVNAIVFNNFDIVKLLCEHKAKVEGIIVYGNLTMVDLAVLHGKYDIAVYLYNLLFNKTLKTVEEYEALNKKSYLRYVNYSVIVQGLKNGKPANEIGDYLTKPTTTSSETDDEQPCCWCCGLFFWSKPIEANTKKPTDDIEAGTDRKLSGRNSEKNSEKDSEKNTT